MNTNLTVKHISDLDEFESLRASWERLLEQTEVNDVFLTWEWLIAWWKTYGSDKKLWLITIWENDELVGCAPLMLLKKRISGITFRYLQTLGTPESDRGGFLVKENNLDILIALIEYILQKSPKWDIFYLKEFQYEDQQTKEILNIFERYKLNKVLKIREQYYIPIKGEWNDFINSLSKNTRKNLMRRRKRAEESGKLRMERYQGDAIHWDHFETIFKVNRMGNFPELYIKSEDQEFHCELATQMRDKGWMNIDILSIDDTPVAFQYGFFYRGKYEDWRGGFDKSYSQLSLGTLLLSMSLERLFNDGFREHDFLRGGYDYKAIWNSESRKFAKINVAAPKNLKALVAFIILPKLRHWVKSKIKR